MVPISYVVPCVLALSQHLNLAQTRYLLPMVAALQHSMDQRFEPILKRVRGERFADNKVCVRVRAHACVCEDDSNGSQAVLIT